MKPILPYPNYISTIKNTFAGLSILQEYFPCRSALPHLVSRRPGDGHHHERLHAAARVEVVLLGVAGVDDVGDAVDGQRRLRDVRRKDHLWWWDGYSQ